MAERMFSLLSCTNQLREYLRRAQNCDCYPITRLNPLYPTSIRHRLGLDSPGVLWAKGDLTLLKQPAMAVIGSRELAEKNRKFAEAAGCEIAKQGYTLVSGNARGADKAAQNAALQAGGTVISVVADSLQKQPLAERMLYLSLDDFDAPFSSQRALQRNHVIHAMTELTIAAQCTLGKGGTWDGTVKNLRHGWSSVACFWDGSEACRELEQMGAYGVDWKDLGDLTDLVVPEESLFDR